MLDNTYHETVTLVIFTSRENGLQDSVSNAKFA